MGTSLSASRRSVAGSLLLTAVLSLGLIAPASASAPPAGSSAPMRPSAAALAGNAAVVPSPPQVADAGTVAKGPGVTSVGRVTGRVVDPAGLPLSGLGIQAVPLNGPATPVVLTGSDGRYALELPAGQYLLKIRDPHGRRASGWYGAGGFTTQRSAALPVTVGARDLQGIDLRVPLAASSGARTPRAPRTPRTGAVPPLDTVPPGPQAHIERHYHRSRFDPACGYRDHRMSDERRLLWLRDDRGQRHVLGVGPGQRQLPGLILRPQRDYAPGWYSSSAAGHYAAGSSSASDVVVGTSNVTGINAILPLAPHIKGTVTGPSPTQLADIIVTACTVTGGSSCYSATPDAGGTYSVAVAPGLSYQVMFMDSANIFVAGYYGSAAPGHLTLDPQVATTLAVGAGDVTGISVTLPLYAHISGTITGLGSTPLAGISVEACTSDYTSCGSAETAADGTYAAAVAPGFSYQISLTDYTFAYAPGWYSSSAPGHYTAEVSGATNVAVGTADVTGIDVTLPLPVHISGTVTGSGSTPLGGISVEACQVAAAGPTSAGGVHISPLDTTGGCGLGTVATAANGTYAVAVAPGLSYQVGFADPNATYVAGYYASSEPGHFTIDSMLATSLAVAASDVSKVNVTMPLAVHIKGTVTGPGAKALANIGVQACASTGAGSCSSATTAANGTYSVSVAPGLAYWLSFDDPSFTYVSGYYSSSAVGHISMDSALASTVVVGATDLSGVNVSMTALVHIKGTVTGPGAKPIAGIQVVPEISLSRFGGGYGPGATTAANGTYSVPVAPGQSYRIGLSDPGGTYSFGYYGSTSSGHFTADRSNATNIAVGTGDVSGINVTLPLAVHVSGIVTGAGRPPWRTSTWRPACRPRVRPSATAHGRPRTAATRWASHPGCRT